MINDPRGGVVVPPLSEPTNCPSHDKKKLPGAPGSEHSKKIVRYTTVTLRHTASAVQPVYQTARALPREVTEESDLGRILARLYFIRVLNRPFEGLQISCHYIIAMRCKCPKPIVIMYPAIVIQFR
jgi:hypothetical protein